MSINNVKIKIYFFHLKRETVWRSGSVFPRPLADFNWWAAGKGKAEEGVTRERKEVDDRHPICRNVDAPLLIAVCLANLHIITVH